MQVVSLVLDLTSFKSDIYQIQAEQETKFKNGEPCAAQELLEPFKKYARFSFFFSLTLQSYPMHQILASLNVLPKQFISPPN